MSAISLPHSNATCVDHTSFCFEELSQLTMQPDFGGFSVLDWDNDKGRGKVVLGKFQFCALQPSKIETERAAGEYTHLIVGDLNGKTIAAIAEAFKSCFVACQSAESKPTSIHLRVGPLHEIPCLPFLLVLGTRVHSA